MESFENLVQPHFLDLELNRPDELEDLDDDGVAILASLMMSSSASRASGCLRHNCR